MKIAFALWGTLRTGGTSAIFNIADRLAKFGHEVIIISLGARNHTWYKFDNNIQFYYPEENKVLNLWAMYKKRRVNAIEVIDYTLRKRNSRINIERYKTLTNALNTYAVNYDAVIATMFETAFSVSRMNAGRHNNFYFIQHFESVSFNDIYSQKRVHETYFFPFSWIVNSTWANMKLLELTGKIGKVVTPGIDTLVYYPRQVYKDKTNKVIVSLGKSMDIKGLKYLFDALVKISKKISNIKLILYGVEPTLKRVSPVPTEYIVSPSDEQLAELYSVADVVVTPSLYESSPLPPLEAMACGSPVVTTRFGTEDYCFDGENSLVVPPQDPDALAHAIIRILSDSSLANKLSENGLISSKLHSWDNTAQNFEKLLKENTRQQS